MDNLNLFMNSVTNQMKTQGMTFDPAIDLRKDLVNFYGFSLKEANEMTDEEVFSFIDNVVEQEDGYVDDEYELPKHFKDMKCDCGGKWNVDFVDCETRGDCEIYMLTCKSCGKDGQLNYAAEWFEEEKE